VRAWADLDLGGIRIVRLIGRAAGVVESILMDASTLTSAARWIDLKPDQATMIRRDLNRHSGEALADTLREIVALNRWIEQETLIGLLPSALSRNDA